MQTQNKRTYRLTILASAALCTTLAFTLGVQTAGDVRTFEHTTATGQFPTGDIDQNGFVGLGDVRMILEMEKGYLEPTPEQLRLDPNQDGELNLDDALRLLYDLEFSPRL